MSIKKIAEMTGVSPATVSRILNNPNYHSSSQALRDKVWDAAMEINYVPNASARNLKLKSSENTQKAYYINILMTRMETESSDPFFRELLHIIESEIHKNLCILSKVWYQPVFSNDKKCNAINLDKHIDSLYQETDGHADGLIIIGKCNQRALQKWRKKYKSIVSVNRNSTNYEVDEVLCNGQKIAAMATEYLISLGHTEIGYVGECDNEVRYLGFTDTLEKYQLQINPAFIINTTQTEAAGYAAMKKFFKMTNAPSAIYCANDITAIGMLKHLNLMRSHYYQPSIIASDDIEQAQFTTPMLTTVHLPKYDMGKFALYLLLDRIKGGHQAVTRIEMEGKLVIRSSCSNNHR